MQSLEINKIAGAVLTAGIVALMSGFIAEVVFEREHPEGLAYRVTVEGEGEAVARGAAPAVEPLAPLLVAASAEAGAVVAKKCGACHSFDEGGPNKIGPNLWNIVNRPVAAAEGYSYSNALQDKSGETWSYENLNAFVTKPKDWAPGTKMGFAGIKKAADRADLIAYLRSQSGDPAPLPQ